MTTSTPLAILAHAKRLIKKGWTQHAYARTSPSGRPINPESKKAGAWCLIGALQHAEAQLGSCKSIRTLLHACLRSEYDLAYWNDDPRRTQDHVLALLDKAMAKAKKGGPA